MGSNFNWNKWQSLPSLRFVIIVVLTLGIFFRFVNLDRKIYGFDETFSSIRVSGYTEAEVAQRLSKSYVIGIKELQKYQFPNREKGVVDTIKGLAVEEPHIPPLYFVLARFWVQWFGSYMAVMRSLSAVFSVLSLPCIYWLCLELFESPLIGWVAVILVAVSPFHVLFAQEARPYSLWTMTILLSSASLLRAMRLKTVSSWSLYVITLVAGFYSYLFSILVAIGHGVYVVAIEKFRLSKTLTAYLVSSVLGTLAFLPWLLVIISNRTQARSATSFQTGIKASLLELLQGWFRQPGRAFLELNPSPSNPSIYRITLMLSNFILLILVAYSLYFLCRKTSKRTWLFILILIGSTLIPLALEDLIMGGVISTLSRYLTPSYLGFEIAVAYFLTTKITDISSTILQRKLWRSVLVAVVSVGVLCCVVISQAEWWWNKGKPETLQDIIAATQLINNTSHPLLISDTQICTLMSVSYLLNPRVQILVTEPYCALCRHGKNDPQETELIRPKIPDGFSDIFLYPYPSKRLLQGVEEEHKYRRKVVSQLRDTVLWEIEK